MLGNRTSFANLKASAGVADQSEGPLVVHSHFRKFISINGVPVPELNN